MILDIPADFTMRRFPSYFRQDVFLVLKRKCLSSLRDTEITVSYNTENTLLLVHYVSTKMKFFDYVG